MNRARHEHQIRINSPTFGNEFANALYTCMNRRPGRSWFTDEQIAELRAEMIQTAWFRHKFRREQRKRRAA